MNHTHHNHHGHSHTHTEEENTGKNLLVSALLNLVVTIAEVLGGLFSNSLALLSDALHNLGDTSAIFIAFLANLISKKEGTSKKTFGFKRIEILAALIQCDRPCCYHHLSIHRGLAQAEKSHADKGTGNAYRGSGWTFGKSLLGVAVEKTCRAKHQYQGCLPAPYRGYHLFVRCNIHCHTDLFFQYILD